MSDVNDYYVFRELKDVKPEDVEFVHEHQKILVAWCMAMSDPDIVPTYMRDNSRVCIWVLPLPCLEKFRQWFLARLAEPPDFFNAGWVTVPADRIGQGQNSDEELRT